MLENKTLQLARVAGGFAATNRASARVFVR